MYNVRIYVITCMRVGVVPFREKKGRFQICLISSLSKPKRMTFPKGLTKK